MQDIAIAMGPDAKGLHISQEALPDLFALTASRIEENPKQFIVEQPYVEGRWQGGKAVIEYARDLSYTLVSVYDKTGHRQRIYSVRTKFTEHAARQQTRSSSPSSGSNEPDLVAVPVPDMPASQQTMPANRLARSSAPGAAANGSFEWDEAKGAYVPSAGETTALVSE